MSVRSDAGTRGSEVPEWLISRRALDRIARREDLGVGGNQPPGLGAGEPLPARPEDRHRERLHVAGRDVDDQARELSSGYGLEVVTDRIDVPVRDELGARLEHRPRLANEGRQAAPGALGAQLVAGGTTIVIARAPLPPRLLIENRRRGPRGRRARPRTARRGRGARRRSARHPQSPSRCG